METVSVIPQISIEIFNEVRKFSSCFVKKRKDHIRNIREIFRGSLLQKESFLTSVGKNISQEVLPRTLCTAFSNTLGKVNLEKMQNIYIKNKGKNFVNEKTFLFIDGGDIQKKSSPIEPFSKKEDFGNSYERENDKNYPLEKVCGNIDGSEGHKPGKGYWLEGIMAYGETSKKISAININLYSTQEKEYKSAFDEQKKGLKKVQENFTPSSFDRVVVEDRGGDDISKFSWYLESNYFSFLTRINTHKSSRKLIDKQTGELITGRDIASREKISIKFLEEIERLKNADGKDDEENKKWRRVKRWKNRYTKNPKFRNKIITSQIGYKKVFLKEYPESELTLIFLWSDIYEEPLLLLTDQKTSSIEEAWKHFFIYRKRWEIEKMYRELKQNFGLEKILVRSLEKQKSFAFLLMMIWEFSRKLQRRKQQILGFAVKVFEEFLRKNQKKNTHFSFLSFLREILQPLSEVYSHRSFSRYFSVLRLPPNDSQLSLFSKGRMS